MARRLIRTEQSTAIPDRHHEEKDIPEFAKKIDGVLDILDSAADGLTAMADAGGPEGESEFG